MSSHSLLAVMAALAVGACAAIPPLPAGQVVVAVPKPDAVEYAAPGTNRKALFAELAGSLQRSAAPRLPPGSTLRVTLLEVDLAGRYEPWRAPALAETRIVRDVYSPRVKLAFALTDAGGRLLREGERTLRDPSGAILGTPDLPADPLRFEKRLLEDWVEREFPASGAR